jgi:hypothetical protein
MKRKAWIFGIGAIAVVAPQAAESVSWSASGSVFAVFGPAPVVFGTPVNVTWSYNPGQATPLANHECADLRDYELASGAGNIHIEAGSRVWDREMAFIKLENDASCDGATCYEGGDVIWFSSNDEIPGAYAAIGFVDCYHPFDLLNSTAVPAVESDLNRGAASGVMGFITENGWGFNFTTTVSVSASTWTGVKAIYR